MQTRPVPSFLSKTNSVVKGGYLDFSHLTKLKNIHITEICMKKKKTFFDGVLLKGYVDFAPEIKKKKHCGNVK